MPQLRRPFCARSPSIGQRHGWMLSCGMRFSMCPAFRCISRKLLPQRFGTAESLKSCGSHWQIDLGGGNFRHCHAAALTSMQTSHFRRRRVRPTTLRLRLSRGRLMRQRAAVLAPTRVHGVASCGAVVKGIARRRSFGEGCVRVALIRYPSLLALNRIRPFSGQCYALGDANMCKH